VPGLLLGTVVGITRSIYKLPGAVKTCWGEGIKVALRKTVESYKIDSDKVVLAVCTVCLHSTRQLVNASGDANHRA
jgi:hypothetical protein